jgi:hypothetical protein
MSIRLLQSWLATTLSPHVEPKWHRRYVLLVGVCSITRYDQWLMTNYPSRHPSGHMRELAQLDFIVVTVRWKRFSVGWRSPPTCTGMARAKLTLRLRLFIWAHGPSAHIQHPGWCHGNRAQWWCRIDIFTSWKESNCGWKHTARKQVNL